MRQPIPVKATPLQVRELKSIVARPSESAGFVRRARVVLMTLDGKSVEDITDGLELTNEAVSRIRSRFRDGGVEGLRDRPKAGRKDHAVPSETVERIVQLAMSPPRQDVATGPPAC